MNDSTNQPKVERQQESLKPYAITGVILLLVFVTAILMPDYFNFRLRLARIEMASKTAATQPIEPAPTGSTNNKSGTNNISAPTLSSSKTESDNLMPASTEPKSSEIFETYGKLLTMLLAFVSVLGVFFGYFVRKSLRDVEDDMRRQVADTMGFWEKEKNRVFGQLDSKLAEVTTRQVEVDKTIANSKQALEALQVAAKAEGQKPISETGLAASAVAAIDADNTIPAPPGGE